ncbi:MAG: NAD-dependent epimerase/dehydratase family protein [Alistipes indistinctus]
MRATQSGPAFRLRFSSSVYGGNTKTPFSEEDRVDNPCILYAATKNRNELMAYVYSGLYGIPTTGLRFFTVYGPWGRPDMAPHAIRRSHPRATESKYSITAIFTRLHLYRRHHRRDGPRATAKPRPRHKTVLFRPKSITSDADIPFN